MKRRGARWTRSDNVLLGAEGEPGVPDAEVQLSTARAYSAPRVVLAEPHRVQRLRGRGVLRTCSELLSVLSSHTHLLHHQTSEPVVGDEVGTLADLEDVPRRTWANSRRRSLTCGMPLTGRQRGWCWAWSQKRSTGEGDAGRLRERDIGCFWAVHRRRSC